MLGWRERKLILMSLGFIKANVVFLLLQTCVPGTDYTTFLLTEDMDSNWTYRVWTNCSQLASKENTPAEITIKPPRPRGKKENAEMTLI